MVVYSYKREPSEYVCLSVFDQKKKKKGLVGLNMFIYILALLFVAQYLCLVFVHQGTLSEGTLSCVIYGLSSDLMNF